ncbi:DUF2812 domain-containing protein [Streptococcus chenjunshii]|uniref:DUF2812 domain-containing protein n=1 Tax=Streptococcus chenjunshii TaxID=2173853 RepID=A0A372KL08_9STRE|nr:DUF2812 domain-containing protein [Streptococcus chenjunshii]AXQ79190.1 DUF2812 domain-containing protein [Streptococcus chenjunshii]RFU50762.1 DUF2812 domain-containing protein [Streptococcus chenjunshii]RFU52943.1 DUF2812 domain-containing protein [Streptococcus chenjunshii]
MKTTVKKAFLDIQKEEEWLNEQGEKGLMLVECHNGSYEFEVASPAKFQYKIDLPDYIGSKKKDYLSFLKQSGISVVSEYGGRVYLRKNTADGPLSLYTDSKGVRRQMNKRYTHFFIIGITHFLLGITLLLQTLNYAEQRGVPFWFTVIVGIGFMISGMIFLFLGIRKHRQYAAPKDETRLWE